MWYSLIDLQRSGENEVFARVRADSASPLFAGHFPGDPTLPGIGQLDMVADVISRLAGDGYAVSGLVRVKFRRRVQPGETLAIYAAGKDEATYSFRITTGEDELVSSGVMRIAPIHDNG